MVILLCFEALFERELTISGYHMLELFVILYWQQTFSTQDPPLGTSKIFLGSRVVSSQPTSCVVKMWETHGQAK